MKIKNNGKKSIMVGVDGFIHPNKVGEVSQEEGKRILKLYDFCQDEKDFKDIEAKAKDSENEALKALEELEDSKLEIGKLKAENAKLKGTIDLFEPEILELKEQLEASKKNTSKK